MRVNGRETFVRPPALWRSHVRDPAAAAQSRPAPATFKALSLCLSLSLRLEARRRDADAEQAEDVFLRREPRPWAKFRQEERKINFAA